MWVDDIEKTFPSGFHDSEIQNINIDILNRTIEFKMEIDMADPDKGENYIPRIGVLTINGVGTIFMDQPYIEEASRGGGLWIKTTENVKEYKKGNMKGFCFCIYQWKIKFSGESAEIKWL
jgi:hypothetical protein